MDGGGGQFTWLVTADLFTWHWAVLTMRGSHVRMWEKWLLRRVPQTGYTDASKGQRDTGIAAAEWKGCQEECGGLSFLPRGPCQKYECSLVVMGNHCRIICREIVLILDRRMDGRKEGRGERKWKREKLLCENRLSCRWGWKQGDQVEGWCSSSGESQRWLGKKNKVLKYADLKQLSESRRSNKDMHGQVTEKEMQITFKHVFTHKRNAK